MKNNQFISGKVPSTAKLQTLLVKAMGERYTPALDATIYVAAQSLRAYAEASAELNALKGKLTYESTSDRGAKRILVHPIVQTVSNFQRDAVNALKALGLSMSKLEKGGEIDPIDELEQ